MKKINFNDNWIFYSKENPKEKHKVHLPYDAMLREKRIPDLYSGSLVAFFPAGDYYYEKSIYGKEEYEDKTIFLEFEGIYMDSHIFLNGEEIGGHGYGYSNFYVDLTDKLVMGIENEIRVFVRNSLVPNARWYSGSGIIRPVWLHISEKEHILPDGIHIVTKDYHTPAIIEVQIEAEKDNNTKVITEILWDGNVVASGEGICTEIKIDNPKLWNAEHPNLYSYRIYMQKEDRVIDEECGKFGIRKLEWSAENGFVVNGETVKLRGGCVHHDNGIIGAESFKEAEYRKVRILKAGGFNAIRGAHDPRPKEMLNACDELGMYVMEEAFDVWYNNRRYGYTLFFEKDWKKDLELMVRKCRIHPSVIMYSTGNEVSETATDIGIALAGEMTDFIRGLDNTRPVTNGVNLMLNVLTANKKKEIPVKKKKTLNDVTDPKATVGKGGFDASVAVNLISELIVWLMDILSRPLISDKSTKGVFSKLDIAGYNYGDNSYEKHHKWHPKRIMVGTESKPSTMAARWEKINKLPYVVGDFLWTAWDYLGECGIGIVDYVKNSGGYSKPYPAICAGCGVYDITGIRDTEGYEAAIIFGAYEKPYIAARHPMHYKEKTFYGTYRGTDAKDCWTFPGFEGEPTQVEVYSTGDRIKLLLNEQIIGTQKINHNKAVFKDVIYEKGTLKAISLDKKGKKIAESCLSTAGEQTLIDITCEKYELTSGFGDLAYLSITLTDENGIWKPLEKKIVITVEGAGNLYAVGSGAHRTEESYLGNSFTTSNGRMLAIIRSNEKVGDIKVKLEAEGLEVKIVYLKAIQKDIGR